MGNLNIYSTPLTGEETIITTADGTRIKAVHRGEGRPVVLAHGYAVDHQEWNIIAGELVIGTHDKTTPPFHTDQLHAGIKGSRLVKLPGKGHILNWEAPEILVEEIARLAGQ